jgi:hypothetical protein
VNLTLALHKDPLNYAALLKILSAAAPPQYARVDSEAVHSSWSEGGGLRLALKPRTKKGARETERNTQLDACMTWRRGDVRFETMSPSYKAALILCQPSLPRSHLRPHWAPAPFPSLTANVSFFQTLQSLW